MSTATIRFRALRPLDGVGFVNEASVIPVMRPRTGQRGSDSKLAELLSEALDNLSKASCSFWACEGPIKVQHMATCVKCHAMRRVATVKASLEARSRAEGR